MIQRDADKADTLSQLGSELQLYHLHVESESDEFRQSHAEMRQHLERSNTERAQFRRLHEETRTANASVAPEVTHLRAKEKQLFN